MTPFQNQEYRLKATPIVALLFSFIASVSIIFAPLEADPLPPTPVADKSSELKKPDSAKASLESLTSAEKTEFLTAYQKALTDPAVQSTREITRITLHKAMLKADPSIETILANMNAYNSQNGFSVSRSKKSLGGDFQHWLDNFCPAAVSSLSPTEKETLKKIHAKALLDPSVQEAKKTAHATFYNAIFNADPLIGPIMNKLGIPAPSTVQPLSNKSSIESEEKILGGDFQAWGEEILAPNISNQEKPDPLGTSASSADPDEK
jgi:hypothetical protein